MTKPYPTSTYRLQLHAGFNFRQLQEILDYLHMLGISTIYASPVLQAIRGSQHGYDAADPRQLNNEIGTEAEWDQIQATLKKYGMNWLQDIVPNHMAFESSNPWLFDVLERGSCSEFYSFFDIFPAPAHGRTSLAEYAGDKLMVPFLGKTLTECLRDKELKLEFSERGFVIRYFEKVYPVAIPLYRWICTIAPGCPPVLLDSFAGLELAAEKPSRKNWQAYKLAWLGQISGDEAGMRHIRRQLSLFEEEVSLLAELTLGQHYLLTQAGLAARRINYRRFFIVNSLICLRMEDEKVFSAYHNCTLQWYRKGWIQGLRIDHIDGLASPGQYVRRLKQAFGEDCYIVAEKILQEGEDMPGDWPLEGTTGYEFLSSAGQLLTDPDGSRDLLAYYREKIVAPIRGEPPSYEELVYDRKLDFLLRQMGGELENLIRLLESLPLLNSAGQDKDRLRDALASLMASFPVYRLYPEGPAWSASDMRFIHQAFRMSRRRQTGYMKEFDYFEDLLGKFNAPEGSAAREQRRQFLSRLMQFTGPLAAKGVEDTVFYVYNPYIGHNEVGDTPSFSGITPDEFHRKMLHRLAHMPHSLNGTTTHDTKRGEDARVRLYMLSARPRDWISRVDAWQKMNEEHCADVGGRRAPSPNDEYFIYQSILGSFPADLAVTDDYRERFNAFLVKALREGKTQTNYDEPDLRYEEQCIRFARALFTAGSGFLEDFIPFARKIFQEASTYSLSLALIKMTAPGIPDIYQGAELWDLSLVDPDNRRPIDYSHSTSLLRQIIGEEKKGDDELHHILSARQNEGAAKLWIIHKTLCFRKDHLELFSDGEYIPVPVKGPGLAYIRHWQDQWALVIAAIPRLRSWSADSLQLSLPPGCPAKWAHVLTNKKISLRSPAVISGESWGSPFPVALLKA
jgi:(1->4)-alpha-D-glucan 1-alpha-D-glucosylmutase